MDRTLKIVGVILAVVVVASIGFLFLGTPAQKVSTSAGTDTIYFFYGKECPHCEKVMPFITNLTAKYPDANIQVLEVWHNQTNAGIYKQANAAAGLSSAPGVPEVIIGKTVLIGENQIPDQLEGLVQEYLKKKQ
jgi:hypothetical protein